MDFTPTREEVSIIYYTSIVWSIYEFYRDWDDYSRKFSNIYNWFTSDTDEADVQPIAGVNV